MLLMEVQTVTAQVLQNLTQIILAAGVVLLAKAKNVPGVGQFIAVNVVLLLVLSLIVQTMFAATVLVIIALIQSAVQPAAMVAIRRKQQMTNSDIDKLQRDLKALQARLSTEEPALNRAVSAIRQLSEANHRMFAALSLIPLAASLNEAQKLAERIVQENRQD